MNIFKLLKGAKFDHDQIKEENVIRNFKFSIFLFLTTLNDHHLISTKFTFLESSHQDLSDEVSLDSIR